MRRHMPFSPASELRDRPYQARPEISVPRNRRRLGLPTVHEYVSRGTDGFRNRSAAFPVQPIGLLASAAC